MDSDSTSENDFENYPIRIVLHEMVELHGVVELVGGKEKKIGGPAR